MKEPEQFFILINNFIDSNLLSLRNSSSIHVSLRDKKGTVVEEITENALLSDKDFRDLSGLSIGLTRAKKLGARKILIVTNNIFLGILIKNEPGKAWRDNYGFHADIKRLINTFELVEVKIVSHEGKQRKAA
ncbi:MAG: reverse transcriptase-like protein [bacterium]